MKKLMKWMLAMCMCMAVMSGCAKGNELPEKVRVITLAGPTGMSMAKLIDDAEKQETELDYEFMVASGPEMVKPEVIKGTFDIAAVPVNLASVLYNKAEVEIQVVGVNTLGVLYVLENGNSIQSVEDLRGKTIYATGQGSTPEYVLRYILSKNNIDPDKDVTIEFLSEHVELAMKMKNNDVAIGMLPEPQVTSVTMGRDTRIALDLTQEWRKISDYELIQGCLIVRKEFAQEYPDALEVFLKEYEASVSYTKENIEEAATLIEKTGIVPKAAVAKAALPNCNITLITGKDMSQTVKEMLQVLYEANPASVGGTLPPEDFYLE